MPWRFVLGDRSASVSAAVCAIGLGGFLLWAGLVPLDEAVSAPGQIVVEDNRKVVQHLEGGIVRRLHVREGQEIEEGSILLELDDVRARAMRDQAAQKVAALRAARDRLTALTGGLPQLHFAPTDDLDLDDARIVEIQAQERAVFAEQRDAFVASTAVLGARSRSLGANASAKAAHINAVQRSLTLVQNNLARQRALLAERLIRRDVVDQLEQQESSLRAELARLNTEHGDSIGQAGEIAEQMGKARADFLAETARELLKTRTELQSAEEELRAANDVMERTVIRAPRSGKILNLAFTTLRGVIRPGEPILEIVPRSPALIAQIRISPGHRDAVYAGLPVTARLSVNKSWSAPSMDGRVIDISADLKTVQQTGVQYYEARVRLTPTPALLKQFPVLPGMPVETSIKSGNRRTFLSYLVEPIRDMMMRGL
jgi:HlyD family type I secretion membrane fusion protein